MPTYSEITITFGVDFDIDYTLQLSTTNSGVLNNDVWTWVASRSGAFEVTTGTPTATAGERTAINFLAAFLLDNPTGYTTSQTTNSITIQSETLNEDFAGIKALDDVGTALVKAGDVEFSVTNYVVPVDNTNIELALVRSPHYINIPFYFTTTTAVTINIYIWDGDLTSVPASATYTETITRPTTDFTEFNINLSDFCESEIEASPNINVSTSPAIVDSTSESVKWLHYTVSFTDAVESIVDIEGTFSAVEGYGLYSEGVNPTKPANDFLSSCQNRKVSRDGVIILPFVNSGSITSIDVDSDNGNINGTLTPTSSNLSTKFIQYVEVDVSDATDDYYITITDGTTSFLYEIVDECRFNPKTVIFKNKYGAFDHITLFKKQTTRLNVDKSQFVNQYLTNGVYDVTDHQIKDINITAKESITLNSGYISEDENELYRQMMVSDQVYFYESGSLVPVRPSRNSLDFKTRVNDGLVNYEMEFEYAYNYIQNV